MSAQDALGRQFHEMSRPEFEALPGTMFHGSPNGVVGMKIADYGLHVGSKRAALEALSARAGSRGPRPTTPGAPGEHMMGGPVLPFGSKYQPPTDEHLMNALENTRESPAMSGKVVYSDRTPVYAPDPDVIGGRVTGPMVNTQFNPRSDTSANASMRRYVPRGKGRRGAFYTNEGEDAGSISAALPARSHFKTHEDYLVEARAAGKRIPSEALKGYKQIPGQGRLF